MRYVRCIGMKRYRTFLPALLALAVLGCGPDVPDVRPNVLFIAVDDLNDWTGALGGHPQAQTPNIDRLASEGVLFTNAHCAAPLCTPSRTAVFTGQRPETTGVYSNSDRIDHHREGVLSLPEYFRVNGYRTMTAGKTFPAGVAYRTAAWDVQGPESGVRGPQGGPFTAEEYDRTGKPPQYLVERLGVTRPLSGMFDRRTHHRGGSFDWGGLDLPDDAFGDGVVAEWTAGRLRSIGEGPFFMAAGFYRPHTPLYAPQVYFDSFPPRDTILPNTRVNDLDDVPDAAKSFALVAATAGAHHWVTEARQWNNAVAGYLACVKYADAQVGKVLEALEESGRAEETIVVLWSDHGWHLGEKQHWGKATGWEESTRTPLIIRLPEAMRSGPFGEAFQPGRRFDDAVSLLDLFPTLVELAGLPPAAGLAGRGLGTELRGRSVETTEPFRVVTFGRGNHTVVQGHWRYLHYFDGSEELYDMTRDPDQFHNMAGEEGAIGVLERLRVHLPEEPEIAWTAGYRHFKAVQFRDTEREPLLFDLTLAEGITDSGNVAAEHPEVLERIRGYVAEQGGGARHIRVPVGE